MDKSRVVSAEQPVPLDDRRRVRRAERGVAACLALAVLSAAAFCVVFVAWPWQFVRPDQPGHTLYLLYTPALGVTLGGAVILLGVGMTLYIKRFLLFEPQVVVTSVPYRLEATKAPTGRAGLPDGRSLAAGA